MSGNWATSSPGEADWAVLLIHCGHRSPQFELQFASSGRTFPGGMSHRMSSPGACFGLSLTDGNGGCGTGTCYRGCWQLNTNRIWPCCIFINSGTALWGVQVEGVLSVRHMLAWQQMGLIKWSKNAPLEVSLLAALSPAGSLQLLTSA